jgi:hypothetical protein
VLRAEALGPLSTIEEKSLLVEEDEKRRRGISCRCAQHLGIDLHLLGSWWAGWCFPIPFF